MPRILHLFNIFGASTERAMLDYPLALAAGGWQLTAGYESLAEGCPVAPFPCRKLARIHVEPEPDIPRQMDRISRLLQDPALRSLLDEPVDLVHGHFGTRILHGAPWLRRGTPMVVSLYGYDATRLLLDPCWIERYRWAAGHGATFVTLARSMADRVVAAGLPRARVRLIRLGVAIDEHAFEPRPAPRTPRFVFIGRLVEKKGLDVLLRAMAALTQIDAGAGVERSATLDVIGSGPLEASMRQLNQQLPSGGRVRFIGPVPFSGLFALLRGATALVQPSVLARDGDSEGAPMVLMHAQASGVPCITTAHAGNPEVLPPEAQSFVVPERDPIALARAMHAMIGLGPSARASLQQKGRDWVQKHYSLSGTAKNYSDLYRELLATPRTGPDLPCRSVPVGPVVRSGSKQ